MASRRLFRLTLAGCSAGLLLFARGLTPAAPQANPPAAAAPSTTVIKAESAMVLVDVVATDKNGRHISDLEAKDFRVYDDKKEQTIASFSHVTKQESGKISGPARYVVLFFDNSTLNPADQIQARKAAEEFVEKTASKDRLMAVVDFGGSMQIAQNFTANAARLRSAVQGVKFGSVQPNEPGQTTDLASLDPLSMTQITTDFAARTVLLSLRNLAHDLRPVPGRKTLILFSAGFPMDSERESELTATIDACNKANVAVYTVDVRGLEALPSPNLINLPQTQPIPGMPPGARLDESPFPHLASLLASLAGGLELPRAFAQHGGGGGGTGGGGGGGSHGGGGGPSPGGPGGGGGPSHGSGPSPSPGGGRGSSGASPGGNRTSGGNQSFYGNIPQRQIIPPFPESVTTNQQVLFALAEGTGGFSIFNTNDFLAGLGKIEGDLDDYYVLGYALVDAAHDGSYHAIKVKVERKGVTLRARNGYFDLKSPDMLAGKPEGKTLEARAASPEPADFPVSLSLPYFYTEPNVARVNLSLQIPPSDLQFEKAKGKYHSEVNILGIAYRDNGSVAARFSDTVKNDLEKKEMKEFEKEPFTYQNAFDIAPGRYELKVVLSAGGQKFGKAESPLVVEPFNGKSFQMSGLALCNQMHPVSQLAAHLDMALLEERTPLVAKGMEMVPTADHRFARGDKVNLYVEVYEPSPIQDNWPKVGVTLNVINRKTNQQVYTTNTVLINEFVVPGSPVIPAGVWVPLDKLQAGEYRLDVQARDSLGNASRIHSTNFALD